MGCNSNDRMEWISKCYQATNDRIIGECVYVCVWYETSHKYVLLVYITPIIPDKSIKHQFGCSSQTQIIKLHSS